MEINNINTPFNLNVQKNDTSKIGTLEKNKKNIEEATKNNKEEFKEKDVALVKKTDSEDIAIAREIEELKTYEKMVIAHERTHMIVGGGIAGAPSYTYTIGPDGKKYVSGGNVTMRIPQANSFENMIRNLKRVKAAATAPSNPSPQDMQTAAIASAREASIKTEYAIKKAKEAYEKKIEEKKLIEKSDSKTLDPIEKMIKSTFTSALSNMKFETRASFEMLI